MLRGWRAPVVAGVCIVLAACSRASEAPPHARDLQLVARLPRCELPAVGDTTGWSRAEGSHVLLPPGFVRDTAQLRFMHGGVEWNRGEQRFSYMGGHWSLDPKGSPGTRRCRAMLGGRTAEVSFWYRDRRYGVSAWPIEATNEMQTMYLGESPDSTDRNLFLRVFQTIQPHGG